MVLRRHPGTGQTAKACINSKPLPSPGFSQQPPPRTDLVHRIFARKSCGADLLVMEILMPRLEAAVPPALQRSSALPLAAPCSCDGQRGPWLVWLHGEAERVRSYQPGAASGPTMPKHGVIAAPERCLLSLAVAAASSRGHRLRLREAVCLMSRSCGHRDISTPSQGSTWGISAICTSKNTWGAKHSVLVSL